MPEEQSNQHPPSNGKNDSQNGNDRARIPPTKPPSAEDFRLVKRLAKQLYERVDDLEKRSKG
jgi:hypothetical protein